MVEPTDVVLVTVDEVTTGAAGIVGLAVLAGTLSALVALSYRWYARERVPAVLALLVGLSAVAIYLNTTSALGRVIDGDVDPINAALYEVGALLVAGAGATVGQRIGDRFGESVLVDSVQAEVDDEVSRLVETVGRVITVELPDEVDDVVGYDPVPPETKEKLGGKQFVFPRNLTVEGLDERLRSRLKTDFAVGTVDMELEADGTVSYLAVGSRASGIGPTLPPATNAVALRADPAFAASTGDLVQVWKTDPMERVLTGELRGVADDVVTVAISASDTPKIDPTRRYRLVTLPVDDRPEREFASLLRVADETYTSLDVEAGSPLHGMPRGALDVTVTAVKPEDGEPVAMPDRDYVLAPGDVVFAIAVPDVLRRLERAGESLDSSLGGETTPAWVGSDGPRGEEIREPTTDTRPVVPEADQEEPAEHAEEAAGPDSEEQVSTESSDPSPARTGTPATADIRADIDLEFDDGDGDRGDSGDPERADGTDVDEVASLDGPGTGNEGTAPEPDDSGMAGSEPHDDDLVDLEEAEISFDDEGDEEDDDLSALDFDDETEDDLFDADEGRDDLFDADEADDDLFDADENGDDLFDADEGGEDRSDPEENGDDIFDADENGEGGGDGEDGSDAGEDDDSGGTSFQQLKEEFEEGEADWGDDVSDSPGGDMRLDE